MAVSVKVKSIFFQLGLLADNVPPINHGHNDTRIIHHLITFTYDAPHCSESKVIFPAWDSIQKQIKEQAT
jgi:hypothetical protein